jgi:hypothetical protein
MEGEGRRKKGRRTEKIKLTPVAYTYNSSNSGGRDQED